MTSSSLQVYFASISPLASPSTPQRSGSSPGSALTRSWSRTHHDAIRIGPRDTSSLLANHDLSATTSSATPADNGFRARRSKSLFVHQTTWRSTFGSNTPLNTSMTASTPPAAATPSLNLFLPAADMNALCRNISVLLSLHERLALSLDHTLKQCGFLQEDASSISAHQRQRSAPGVHLIDGKIPYPDIDGAVRAVLNVLVEHVSLHLPILLGAFCLRVRFFCNFRSAIPYQEFNLQNSVYFDFVLTLTSGICYPFFISNANLTSL